VLFMSTGVIGARLPVEKILGSSADAHDERARARPRRFRASDHDHRPRAEGAHGRGRGQRGPPFRVTGVAKGSGMIHPNMATMLAFLLTDGPMPKDERARVRRRRRASTA
jgi:glutamate N-acetyltransferase/amino-acid N-acetyltransferase